MIGWISILSIALVFGGLLYLLRRERHSLVELDAQMRAQTAAFMDYMMASGVAGTAEVLYTDTGSTERDVRRATKGFLPPSLSWWPTIIGLRVQVDGGAPYDVEIKQHVELEDPASLQPGVTVNVRVDPADPRKAVIDFAKPIGPPGPT
jgi:hypothetical protein